MFGGVTSRCHADDPLVVWLLVEVTLKFAVPTPSGRGTLQELPHVKGLPFKFPLIVTGNPCGSLAVNSSDSFPLHQPESPQRSQTICPVITGGRDVGVGEGVFVNVDVGVREGVAVAVGDGVFVEVGVKVGVEVAKGVNVGGGTL